MTPAAARIAVALLVRRAIARLGRSAVNFPRIAVGGSVLELHHGLAHVPLGMPQRRRLAACRLSRTDAARVRLK